ncbi:MAG: hypothetical protein ACR2IE_01790 [Candidatus Sumerlaeaceae bacterium]
MKLTNWFTRSGAAGLLIAAGGAQAAPAVGPDSRLETFIRDLDSIEFRAASTAAPELRAVAPKVVSTGGQLLLTAPNPTPALEDRLGRAVANSPDGNLLAGAPSILGSGDPGEAYVINKSTGALMLTIPNPAPSPADGFGAFVWSTPTKIVIGAPNDDNVATDAGRAFVYSSGGALLQTLTKPGAAVDDLFGWSVNAVGENVLVGCRHDDTSGTETGSCYMYNSSTGALLRKFTRQPNPVVGDNFGLSVAGVGTRVLVGAPGVDDATTTDCGGAFVFDSVTGNQLFTLSNPHPVDNAFMGFLVRGVGNDFLVGAPSSGYAYLFSGSNGALIREFANPEPGAAATNQFYAVAVGSSGQNIFIGNPKTQPDFTLKGAVYVFRVTDGALRYKIESPLNEFNFGVSVHGMPNNQVLVGENYSNVGSAQRAGRMYLFDVGAATAADTWWLHTE